MTERKERAMGTYGLLVESSTMKAERERVQDWLYRMAKGRYNSQESEDMAAQALPMISVLWRHATRQPINEYAAHEAE